MTLYPKYIDRLSRLTIWSMFSNLLTKLRPFTNLVVGELM